MTALDREAMVNPEHPVSKDETLQRLRSAALQQEVVHMYDLGFDIGYGESLDSAYEQPDAIWEVYDRLEHGSAALNKAAGRLALGSAGLAKSLEHSPLPIVKHIRRRVRTGMRELRANILYDQPDVQAMAWHLQNGKALALGTIVDAHDLYTDQTGGLYPSIAGGLPGDFTDQFFSANASANIAGGTVHDALVATQQEFRAKSQDEAIQKANVELAEVQQFVQTPVQQGFKEIVQYCTDSLGIRSRKEAVREEINRHVEASDKDDFLMMSVGCGTAQPMLEVIRDVYDKGRSAQLILVDQDPVALAAAQALATKMGLEEAIEIHCAKLFVQNGSRPKMMNLESVLQGRKLDVGEDSGLREYFPDDMYRDLTSQVWNALTDDGIMTTGNMNRNRPQAHFLHGLMGWPIKVQMRHVQDITRLHYQAGIPKEAMRLRVTQDGVYTLCFSSKQPI